MYPSQLEFIKHIDDECNYILRVTHGKTKEQILNDETLSKALVRSLEVIGEATKNVNEQLKSRYPQIDWKDMAGMRDKLIHHYFGIDYEIVFDVVTKHIAELHHEIQRILKLESGQQNP